MNAAELTRSQRLAIAVRLYKRIQVGHEVKGEIVGLGGYDCAKCSHKDKLSRGCQLEGRTLQSKVPRLIDYHWPPRDEDSILFCPSSVPGIHRLAEDVYHAIAIEEHGGLFQYFGKPVGSLPEALVGFFEEAISAESRFIAEIRAAGVPTKFEA